MKPQNSRIKEKPGAKGRPRPVPDQYICIAEDEAPEVFDWLNCVSDADPEIGEIHLRLCFHCQEAVATRMTVDKEFRVRVRRCLHAANLRAQRSLTAEPVAARLNAENTSAEQVANDKPRSMKVGGGG